MAIDFKSLTGPLADFLVSELEANKSQVLKLIADSESSAEAAIIKSLKSLPHPNGIFGIVFGTLEPSIESYAKKLVADYGPDVVFTFVLAEARLFAKQLGG